MNEATLHSTVLLRSAREPYGLCLTGERVFYSNEMLIREGLGRTSLDIVIAQRRQGPLGVLLEYGAAENRGETLEIGKRLGRLVHGTSSCTLFYPTKNIITF